jgi:DNA-binding Lrp family transcriptional regulator
MEHSDELMPCDQLACSIPILFVTNSLIILGCLPIRRRVWMPRAYVLLNVETGSEDNVLKRLKSIGVVDEAYVSYGVYDLIIKVKADTMEELKEEVTHKIRTTNQVRSTLTLIMMEE